jgi:hypothetical protein
MRFLTQFLMGKAKVVGASNERHSFPQRFQTCSRVATFPCERGKTFTKSSIQAFTKSSSECRPSRASQHQPFGFLRGSSGHVARDFHDPLFLRPLDHRGNAQIGPRLQGASSTTRLLFDFFPKRSDNTLWIGGKTIRTDQPTMGV